MTTGINTSINQLLAGNYLDAVRQAAAQNPLRVPQVQPQQGATRALEDRRVEQLAGDDQQAKQQGRSNFALGEQRKQTLKDLARPQVNLQPADELELFGETVEPQELTEPAAFVSDTINQSRRQALAANDRSTLAELLRSRAQVAVSNLYARNNDVVYNATPAYSEAA